MDKNQGYAILKAVMLENGSVPLCHMGLLR